MSIRWMAAALAVAVCMATAAADGDELYRIGRQGGSDRDALLAAGVPVVLETATALIAEGGREVADTLRAEGWEVTLLDGSAEGWDYWMVVLREDSDLEALRAAGTVIHTEGEWLLLRLPRGLTDSGIAEAQVFAAPLPHEPLATTRPAPLRDGAAGRRPAGSASALPLVQRLVSSVSPAEIDAAWGHLSPPNIAPTPTRYTTLAACGDDSDHVYETLLAWGVPAERQNYYANYAPNVVGTLVGAVTPSRIYIAEGHLDDMPSSGYAPGADDNASGVVVTLEAARALSCSAFRSTLKFLAVTGEETGLNGSAAYASAAAARGDDIRAVINLDMVGWQGNGVPATGEDLDLNCNSASLELGQLFAQCAADYGAGIAVDAFYCSTFTGSDHVPFWQRGYRAVCGITDNEGVCNHSGSYPFYHQSTDTIANCGNPNFLYGVTRATVATLAELAEPFKVTFLSDPLPCGEPVPILVGDRDPNTSPATRQTVPVEVWSNLETDPEVVLLTEEDVDSMLFRGSALTTFGAPVHGDGLVSIGEGATLFVRYVDALDCDGATSVPYSTSAPVQTGCGPVLRFRSHGTPSEQDGDGDAALEPGERWSVPVTLQNAGSSMATACAATIASPVGTVCDGPLAFGALSPGAEGTAAVSFLVPASFAPCGGALAFDVTGKNCAEAAYAGADEPGAFALFVGHATEFPPVSVTLQPPDADAMLDQLLPTSASGAGTTMEVRDRADRVRRSLVAFDLSSLPAGARVLSATLGLYAQSVPSVAIPLEVRRPSDPWTEAVTWSTQPGAGGSDATASGSSAPGWIDWDVTAPVADWTSGASPAYGFLVKAVDETSPLGHTYTFATREAVEASLRPRLQVIYQPAPQWDCPYVGGALCAPPVPGEAAPGDSRATAQTWLDATSHRWPVCDGASGYKIFRGDPDGLPHLLDTQGDSCLRWTGTDTTCTLSDVPPPGSFFWYLVVGVNAAGDGSAGHGRALDSTGVCP